MTTFCRSVSLNAGSSYRDLSKNNRLLIKNRFHKMFYKSKVMCILCSPYILLVHTVEQLLYCVTWTLISLLPWASASGRQHKRPHWDLQNLSCTPLKTTSTSTDRHKHTLTHIFWDRLNLDFGFRLSINLTGCVIIS